jgi:hypothetical protein
MFWDAVTMTVASLVPELFGLRNDRKTGERFLCFLPMW